MRQKASFVFINNPDNSSYEVKKDHFFIGRSPKKADFTIKGDPHISRVHAEVVYRNGRFKIRNLGKNPLVINGKSHFEHVIGNGDVIKLGLTQMKFIVEKEKEQAPIESFSETLSPSSEDEISPNEKTQMFDSPLPDETAPHLVKADASGSLKTFTLDVDQILIGRTLEADIRFNDPAVSRRHCQIFRQNGDYYLNNLSKTNPVKINDREIKTGKSSGGRLYSGDSIRIGENLLTFISDRPQDSAPQGLKNRGDESKKLIWALSAASIAAILIIGAYFSFTLLYLPYKENTAVEALEQKAETDRLEQTRQEASKLLKSGLRLDNQRRVENVIAEITNNLAAREEAAGKIDAAKNILESYLKEHSSIPASDSIRSHLYEITMRRASLMESKGLLEEAINEYASIPGESRYYSIAQSGLIRILNKIRLNAEKEAEVARLIEEGEQRFEEKKYLTPKEQNAYSIYKAVLKIDPENETALKKMNKMKEFYRNGALKYYEQGNCRKSLALFERFMVFESDNPDMLEKYEKCRKKFGM